MSFAYMITSGLNVHVQTNNILFTWMGTNTWFYSFRKFIVCLLSGIYFHFLVYNSYFLRLDLVLSIFNYYFFFFHVYNIFVMFTVMFRLMSIICIYAIYKMHYSFSFVT